MISVFYFLGQLESEPHYTHYYDKKEEEKEYFFANKKRKQTVIKYANTSVCLSACVCMHTFLKNESHVGMGKRGKKLSVVFLIHDAGGWAFAYYNK